MSSVKLSVHIEERKSEIEKLFRSYYKDMCKAAYNVIKDKDTCEDLVQNIFLKLYESDTYQKIDYPASFFKRSAINAAIDLYRKQSKVKFSDIDEMPHLMNEGDFSNFDSNEEEIAKKINEAVDTLPEKCRLIFILKRTEGYSNKEIAEELDLSIKTVENQTTKALKILKEKLNPLLFLLLILELSL